MAKVSPDRFLTYKLQRAYPELAAETTIDKELPVKKDNIAKNNFYSLTRSQFQQEQRHPAVDGLDRYDMGINNSLTGEESRLESEVLSNLFHATNDGHTAVGISGYTKAWALVAFPQPDVLFMEQIQSDLPIVINQLSEEPSAADDLKEKYGEDKYLEFVEKYTKFSQAYPYITIKKAAEMAANSNITEIRISDADTILEQANVKNRKKADRIYDIIPSKLGFSKADTYWVYDGNMRDLYKRAQEMEDRVMGQQKKQVSKRDKPTSVNMEALKADVSGLIGERANGLDFSGGVREFAKSVNMLSGLSNKNKKQIMGLINKHVIAFIRSTLIKIGEIEYNPPLSKWAQEGSDEKHKASYVGFGGSSWRISKIENKPLVRKADEPNTIPFPKRSCISKRANIEYTEEQAKAFVVEHPMNFFTAKLDSVYPHLQEQAAVNFARQDPESFVNLGLDKKFPHLNQIATDSLNAKIKHLAENNPREYFYKEWDLYAPTLVETAIKSLIEKEPWTYFEFNLHIT